MKDSNTNLCESSKHGSSFLLVFTGLVLAVPTELAAQRPNLAVISCSTIASAIRAKATTTDADVGEAMSCYGDRATAAEAMWERISGSSKRIPQLSEYSIGAMNHSLLEKVGRVAASDGSMTKRQGALRTIFGVYDPGMTVHAFDSSGTIVYQAVAIADGSTPPSSDTRARSLEILKDLEKTANSADIRGAASKYLRLQSAVGRR